MKLRPELTEEEWDLVVELLEQERRQLPSEIHHTDSPDAVCALRHRLAVIDGLLQRIRACEMAV